ncbi:MAG: metallophosphoesterase [Acidobacteria bacterium RIFCSPLOWO2_02_FULL_59_13]|nr:MAG: metallophosphoesterase [Acidobacteria bacterium RIFCSPLOWO2_02_FULL_59_13]
MNILFIGDIFGKPGRKIVADHLKDLIRTRALDLVVANAENAAAGFGITPRLAEELLALGTDVLSSGNHIWDRKEILEYFPQQPRLLRPANYPGGPGQGLYLGTTQSGIAYAVLNLQGRVFMAQTDCPFRTAERELEKIPASCKVRIVDMHAEATSEKLAMGWYLDGRVTAVVGTHTHVPTADERVLPNGTAYITDVGMTGPYDSVIGITKETILNRFLTQMPTRFDAAEKDARLCAVVIQADPETGRALRIERLQLCGD